ncbi:hypothetical protein HRF87_05675 [Bacillus sp. CRN 9]|nr:hypothetical protein [Bacillus sp. CRN 9]
MTILPNIVDVAREFSLEINLKTIGKKEVLSKCPFCHEDSKPSKVKRYYLSLNEDKNVFKCWFCKEFGGVVKFLSLLSGQGETQIIEQLRKENGFKYQKHPAEKLSKYQLKLIGYPNVNWVKNREYDYELYKMFREQVYTSWLSFIETHKEKAYKRIYGGILTGQYNEAISDVKNMEKELNITVLEDVLNAISCDEHNENQITSELFVAEVFKKEHPVFTSFNKSIAK